MSEKRAFVHIGLPKTGTTAIQKSLAHSREILRKKNVVYPGDGDAHGLVCARYHPLGMESPYIVKVGDQTSLLQADALLKEALESDRDCILSSEYFHNFGASGIRALSDRFAENGFETHVVCYLRHPVDAAISSGQQAIKVGSRSLTEIIQNPRYIPIRQNLEPIISELGLENVHVRDYVQAAKNGLLKDFLITIGREDLVTIIEPIYANESITMDGAILADMHREHRIEHRTAIFPKHLIFEIGGDRFDLPENTKEKVMLDGKGDLDWVRTVLKMDLQTGRTNTSTYRDFPSREGVAQLFNLMRKRS